MGGGCICQDSDLLTWDVGPSPALWPDQFPHCPGLVPASSVKTAGVDTGESMADTFRDHRAAWGKLFHPRQAPRCRAWGK